MLKNYLTPMNADKGNTPPMNAEEPSKLGVHRRLSAFIGVLFFEVMSLVSRRQKYMTPINADKGKSPPMNADMPSRVGVHRRLSAFIGVLSFELMCWFRGGRNT